MKKGFFLAALFLLQTVSSYSQHKKFYILLSQGKAEFKKEFDKQNYKRAVQVLEQAVNLDSTNDEARYFLGYAYDRLNSKDGTHIPDMNVQLTKKASEQIEKVNKMSPVYKGELLALDPYTKISSIWGSQAMSYLSKNKKDSAEWAFKEGKKRGGFNDFILEYGRQVLNACAPDAYLFSSGDNFTITLWYLQEIEKYRTDVSLVDVSLVNTIWYPAMLKRSGKILVSYTDEELDKIDYREFEDSSVSIPLQGTDAKLEWTIKPNFDDAYILRGAQVLLNILTTNQFKKSVYFTKGMDASDQLNLPYLENQFVIDKVAFSNSDTLSAQFYKNLKAYPYAAIAENALTKSNGVVYTADYLRFEYLKAVQQLSDNGKKAEAKKLLTEMKTKLPVNIIPTIAYKASIKDYEEMVSE